MDRDQSGLTPSAGGDDWRGCRMYVDPSGLDEQQMTASNLAGDIERYDDLIGSCDHGI